MKMSGCGKDRPGTRKGPRWGSPRRSTRKEWQENQGGVCRRQEKKVLQERVSDTGKADWAESTGMGLAGHGAKYPATWQQERATECYDGLH